MLTVYGARTCPECQMLKKNFEFYNIEYNFIDIQESTANLKSFLKMRDNDPFYAKAKEKGLIGIPTLIFDNGVKSFYWKKYLEELGYKALLDDGLACDIKTKSC